MCTSSPLCAIISRTAFDHNIRAIRELAGEREIIFPVKANAYGHGYDIIVDYALRNNINYFAVSRYDEALQLRLIAPNVSIVILGVERGGCVVKAVRNSVELTIGDMENLKEIAVAAKLFNVQARVHLLVDTGMGRLGIGLDDLGDYLDEIKKCPSLYLASVYSHFSMSDESVEEISKQLALFEKARIIVEESAIKPDFYHLSNSGGIENGQIPSWINAVRPGIMCYGFSQKIGDKTDLIPVMSLSASVLQLRDVPAGTKIGYGSTYTTTKETRLAVVAVGYADGLPRACSNLAVGMINGVKYRQVGRISMDLTVYEVDDKVKLNDKMFIFGNNKEAFMTAEDLAGISGRISYEILTGIGNRAVRVVGS